MGYVCPIRFNRYIVECKCMSESRGLTVTAGFNRYIVECKLLKDTFEYGGAIEI